MNEQQKHDLLATIVSKAINENTSALGDTLILEHLATNGKVTLEEAEFYTNLASTVITEMAEEIVPDEFPEIAEAAPIVVFDEAGNKYSVDMSALTPIDAELDGETGEAGDMIGENSDIQAEDELNESTSVVNRILAKMQ